MQKKYLLLSAGFLLALNIICWREVFVLSRPQLLKVDFLAVGQGDAEFIQTPQGHKILIDGGPDSSVLQKISERLPFWDKTIDLVILSHPEKDHMVGILDVLQRYNVKYFVWPGAIKNDAENKKLLEILKVRKPVLVAANAGDKIKAGNTEIDILYPLENFSGKVLKEKDSANDTGIVAKLIFGKESFLFTGDIDMAAEKEIVQKENAKANVLKVAHHGSKYSSSDAFLAAVSPQWAVIEVGKNSYGHPTGETLQRLQNSGIKVMRTDKDSDVKFLSDGYKIQIK